MKRIACLPPQSNWKKLFDPVDALARAILFQQLNGKAASTAVGRVETAIGSKRLHSDTLGRIDVRACGVSGNKTLALRDLSRFVAEWRRAGHAVDVRIAMLLTPEYLGED